MQSNGGCYTVATSDYEEEQSKQYSPSSSDYGSHAVVAYADPEEYEESGIKEFCLHLRGLGRSEDGYGSMCYQGSTNAAYMTYARQEDQSDYGHSQCQTEEYVCVSKNKDNIYTCIDEYEEIDSEEMLEQFYAAIADQNDMDASKALQAFSQSNSCFGTILNPHQLLFGWKSKIPWSCQTTLRTWSRVLSTKMGVQFPVSTSGEAATVSFLRRTLKEYSRRAPSSISSNEIIPTQVISHIYTVFEMAKHKPTRRKRIIGLNCFPMHMSMPKNRWKDISHLHSILEDAKKREKKHSLILASCDASIDRVGQLKTVLTSYYSKKYNLPISTFQAYLADTGAGFRKMHTVYLARRALEALAEPGQSILLPEPSHPPLTVWFTVFQYSTRVTPRHYKRDPGRFWLLDFADIQEKLDDTVAAVFLSNPGVFCGGISSYRELDILVRILEKRGIPLVVEEYSDYLVYDQQQRVHSVLELNPKIPVIIISSSYRWMIFGAQGPMLAWALVYDPEKHLKQGVCDSLQSLEDISMKQASVLPTASALSTFLHYDGWTNDIVRYLAKNAAIAAGILSRTPGLSITPPKSGNFQVILIKLEEFRTKFNTDIAFTTALFNEESVKVVCGSVLVGWKDSFALQMYLRRDLLIEACDRIDEFCRRHAKYASIKYE